MSPKPRLFYMEAEVTQTRIANYYVYAYNETSAEEKLRDVLHENKVKGQGPVILSDDINIQLEQGKPHIRDLSLISIQVNPLGLAEEIVEEDE